MAQKRVLVVEDEKSIAESLKFKLDQAGFFVKGVFDGEQAIEELQKNTYDVVLLDIIMPSVDGWGVLEKIKSLGLPVKIIMISNLSQQEGIDKALRLGATDYIVKANASLAEIIAKVTIV